MAQTPYHVAVMAPEVLELFMPVQSGVIVDATFGGGGHTEALLDAMPDLCVLALDRDPAALAGAPDRPRLRLEQANFGDLAEVLRRPETKEWLDEHCDPGSGRAGLAGVLLDLGVSSHQLDEATRGFSYRLSGPLDMRMGPDAGQTAADLVNGLDAEALARIFTRFGEERYARRIAERIVATRPIDDTAELARVVADAVPAAARRQRHPARRVFQALRIAVNDELVAVDRGLDAALAALRPGGRCVVIAYHSLEDRIVKRRFAAGAAGCVCPPELPVCACDTTAELRRLTRKPWRPSEQEVARNPRARSARLRAVERIAA